MTLGQKRRIRRYSDEFKLKVLALTRLEGVQTEDVAAALLVRPAMLSRWRRDLREGRIAPRPGIQLERDRRVVTELHQLHELRRRHRLLALPDAVWA